MNNKIKWFAAIVILFIAIAQCSKHDEYKKYMPDGEIIYPQKVDSVKTYPGKNRIQLEWVLVDPKVTTCKVFYEQGGIQGSITVPIQIRSDHSNDTTRIIIPGLEETTYAFKIISYDDFGNTSVTVETEESVYGEIYERSLLNRVMKSNAFDEDTGLQIEWHDAENTEVAIKLEYTDINGNHAAMEVTNSEISTTIPDFNISEPLYYSTIFKPVPTCIDTFYAPTVEKLIPYEKQLDRLKFREVRLPGDSPLNPADIVAIKDMWDGDFTKMHNTSARFFGTNPDGNWPHWVTFDTGYEQGVQLSRCRLHGRGSTFTFMDRNIKTFQIWGSMDPNPDGSFDETWTLLLDDEITKPSGLPVGQYSEEDRQAYTDGQVFLFPDDIPKVRYIRLLCKGIWGSNNPPSFMIMQIVLWEIK